MTEAHENQNLQPKVRLLADRILVTVKSEEEKQTPSGIIIPASAQVTDTNSTLQGIVVKVSTALTGEDIPEEEKVYEHEIVLFSKYAGTDLEYEGKNYKIIRITDVIGALE